MYRTIEIRWHGRGGQGTVTAAKTFADACLHSGRYVQAFPEYGPERAGAPLQAYNRISPKNVAPLPRVASGYRRHRGRESDSVGQRVRRVVQ